jgi:serine/threonine protein kinase
LTPKPSSRNPPQTAHRRTRFTPSQRTTNPISPEIEQILLQCLEKDVALRPQSAAELRALLLTCAAAADWPPEERLAWWNAYHLHPVTGQDQDALTPSTPMATVRIDLASRVK